MSKNNISHCGHDSQSPDIFNGFRVRRGVTTLLLLLTLTWSSAFAQLSAHFTHYSTESGLPQYTIMDIIQDHKGFMWFATWDGFSKFDGYTFQNFKVRPGDNYSMRSNRIEHICEDKFGNIWLESYDGEAHCFDPRTEKFIPLNSSSEYQNLHFSLSQIQCLPSGAVWLLSESDGCIRILDSLCNISLYNLEKGKLKGNHVFSVYEDDSENSWILTNNGIVLIKPDSEEPIPYFSENNNGNGTVFQSFYSAIESDNEIYFGSNLGRIWIYQKQNNKFNLAQVPTQSHITDFYSVSEKNLIILTENDGFFLYDKIKSEFKHFNQSNTKNLDTNRISAIYFDSDKQLWFETNKLGIYKFDYRTENVDFFFVKTEDYSMSTFPSVAKVVEDIHGQIWVHPRGGGFSLYDKETNSLEPFFNVESSPDWKFSNILHSLFSDKQGNLWFSSRSHGLEKVTFKKDNFQSILINQDTPYANANDVRAVLQDKNERIWIATKDKRVAVFDKNFKKLGYLTENGEIRNSGYFFGQVYCMLQDSDGIIWLGTKSNGLFKLKETDRSDKFEIKQFLKNENDIYSISDNVIYSIYQDSRKQIWVGTYGNGLNLIQTDDDGNIRFINHRNLLKNYPIQSAYRIRFVAENEFGNICVGTTVGLIMFSSQFNSPDEIEFKHYMRVSGDKESLGNNDVHGILNTRKGELFLVTFGGGLNKVIQYDENGFPLKFKSYTTNDGLHSDICLAIQENSNGQLWVSNENSLLSFDPETETFKAFTEIKQLMDLHNFSEASAFRLKNNDLLFGYSMGIIRFNPDAISSNDFKPYIALSDFRLFNQFVPIGTENSPLSMNIDELTFLKLNRKQNFFSIEFAALDFVFPEEILYAYKLEGFDSDWIYPQEQRIANYTNIPHGDYVFRVKSTNSEGIWVDNERALPIKVMPSFWETPWAYLLYFLLFLGIMYLIFRIFFTFYKLKNNVKIEQQLSEMKLRFFTDISHEIRTPLTMISAPIDYLIEEKDTPDKIKKQLTLVSQNTNRLLRLVNQILDFRKVQQFKLKVEETDLGLFVEKICRNFDEVAKKHHIQFEFINQAENQKIWFDHDCMEKIIINLLSNAFKYTSDGKKIQVIVSGDEKNLSVEVKDEGKGIAKEKQRNLFTRFASFNEDKSQPSTGIGLFIVKDLLEKHAGKIYFESEKGVGSRFVISLLKGTAHFSDEVEFVKVKPEDKNKLVEDKINTFTDNNTENNLPEKKTQNSVLVVEDDPDLRGFIKTILSDEYMIIEAEDGVEALSKALEFNPDFIVSDIMMPRMDGIELLQKLRENINTSHIPIVLLTAKTTIENKLEALDYGADDYITKPFSVPYFKARIQNLLEQRKRLQEIYRNRLSSSSELTSEPQPFIITSQDEILMKKAVGVIEENISDSDFTVENLSQEVGMSRSVFFNKVKSLTGLAPLEFIRDIKMKRAAQLLSTGELMVKEVSYMIGISDTKYFGKCFKAKYGVTPQEYKNQFSAK